MLQQDGRVAWPQVECSVPVCAVQPASASRLQCWHAQWDLWTKGHTEAVGLLADKIEALLKEAQQGKGEGSSKGKVAEAHPTLTLTLTLTPTLTLTLNSTPTPTPTPPQGVGADRVLRRARGEAARAGGARARRGRRGRGAPRQPAARHPALCGPRALRIERCGPARGWWAKLARCGGEGCGLPQLTPRDSKAVRPECFRVSVRGKCWCYRKPGERMSTLQLRGATSRSPGSAPLRRARKSRCTEPHSTLERRLGGAHVLYGWAVGGGGARRTSSPVARGGAGKTQRPCRPSSSATPSSTSASGRSREPEAAAAGPPHLVRRRRLRRWVGWDGEWGGGALCVIGE